MKVGIMQPYFFPYIGYWQLMNAVDMYVIFDDVNFINRGWIHRNRILVDGQPKYFNLPMLGASQNKLINQISLNPDYKLKKRNLMTLNISYKKAPYFRRVYPLLENIILCNEENLAKYIKNSFGIICSYLGISTRFVDSSGLDKDCSLRGQDKVLEICKVLKATDYYNSIGGQALYSYAEFQKQGIQLHFLKPDEISYSQAGKEFQKNLSIIDVMMFNSAEEIKEMLNKYKLV